MTKTEYMSQYRLARREAYLAANGPCVKCGSWDSLEFDHIDRKSNNGDKHASTHMWTWNAKRREAELAKCQILCKECHKEKSYVERQSDHVQTHGTWQSYCRKSNPCRCSLCVAAWNSYMRPKWVAFKQRKRTTAKAA